MQAELISTKQMYYIHYTLCFHFYYWQKPFNSYSKTLFESIIFIISDQR